MLLKRGRPLCGDLYLIGEGNEFMLVLLGDDGSRNWRGYALEPLPEDRGFTIRLIEGLLGADEEGEDWDRWGVQAGNRRAHFQPEHLPDGRIHLWIRLTEKGGGRVLTTHEGLLDLPGSQFLGPDEICRLPREQQSFPGFGEPG